MYVKGLNLFVSQIWNVIFEKTTIGGTFFYIASVLLQAWPNQITDVSKSKYAVAPVAKVRDVKQLCVSLSEVVQNTLRTRTKKLSVHLYTTSVCGLMIVIWNQVVRVLRCLSLCVCACTLTREVCSNLWPSCAKFLFTSVIISAALWGLFVSSSLYSFLFFSRIETLVTQQWK